jgi:molybdopterin converting factor small subunit
MVITWKDDLPEVRSVRRGSTVAEIRAEAASSADADARVNVNMVMVPPSTKLKDGDMIFLSSDGDTKAREHVS